MWPKCFVVPSGRDLKHERKLNTHTRIYVYSSDIQKYVCSGWHHVRTDKQLKYIYTGVFIFECTTTHKSNVIHMCFDSILKWGLAKIYSLNLKSTYQLQCVYLFTMCHTVSSTFHINDMSIYVRKPVSSEFPLIIFQNPNVNTVHLPVFVCSWEIIRWIYSSASLKNNKKRIIIAQVFLLDSN